MIARVASGAVVVMMALGCDPSIVVGRAGAQLSDANSTRDGATRDGATRDAPDSRSAPVLWSAYHESNDLDEWLGDGSGWKYTQNGGTIDVVTGQAHAGSHALLMSISTDGTRQSQAMIGRKVILDEGYYGAWYFVPERPQTDFWVLMKFLNWQTSDVNLFDVDIGSDPNGDPRLFLYEHGVGKISDFSSTTVPIGRWFYLESFFRSTAAADGRLVVSQDQVVILDTGARATAADPHVSWAVGSDEKSVRPTPAYIYIDDAVIRNN